jgi:hypothetical protein
MKIELILLGLIAVVLIVDFILRGIKKKDKPEKGLDKLEGTFDESKKQGKFHYILSRKRNILSFILLVMLIKPLIHYVIIEEKNEIADNLVNIGKAYVKLYLKSSEGKLYKSELSKIDLAFIRIESYSEDDGVMGDDYKRDGFFNKNGDELFVNSNNEYYYFSRTNAKLKSYYTKYYKSKPYFFAISLGGLLILVFLFNDKIKAR